MTNSQNPSGQFNHQLFLASIGAPMVISVYDWTKLFEELKTAEVVQLNEQADSIQYKALKDIQFIFTEFNDIGITKTYKFKADQPIPPLDQLLPKPMCAIIEGKTGRKIC